MRVTIHQAEMLQLVVSNYGTRRTTTIQNILNFIQKQIDLTVYTQMLDPSPKIKVDLNFSDFDTEMVVKILKEHRQKVAHDENN